MSIKSLYKTALFAALVNVAWHPAFAQNGLTYVPDTSFSYYSAFKSVKKSNPEASIPQINLGDSVSSVKDIVYCTINNHALKLDVFSPTKYKGKLPTLLMIFGGGWRSGKRIMHWQMAQCIAARGYIVVTADYRLSTEALYPAAVNDLKTAIKWMRDKSGQYRMDKNKIAVWGFSAGGQLAALIGATGNNPLYPGNPRYRVTSDAVQAVIDVDGILAFVHPESGEGDESKHPSAGTYWFGGTKDQRRDLWIEAGALSHVNKQMPPILFLNSSVDRMHAGREDMIKKLDSLGGIYHEVHSFKGAPHSFNMFEPWFTPTLNYTVAFLDKVLKGR